MVRFFPLQIQVSKAIAIVFVSFLLSGSFTLNGQGGRYWDQNLNSEAALLSGAVVAGESSIAAIYYNPATITEMKKNSLSLSANLFTVYLYNAKNALGEDFPADRTQLDIYPRIVTLVLNPKKKPDLTIELAYFTKANDYMKIDRGNSYTGDIIASNPGNEHYSADYYLRTNFQDYYGGAGFGYKVSESLAFGFSGLISYKDDQYYNLISTNAFTLTDPEVPDARQYLSRSSYHLKYTMYDVRFIGKFGLHFKKEQWTFGTNITLPSVKIFGDGRAIKQYEYSNIHKVAGSSDAYSSYSGGRNEECTSHFKDPLSIAAGVNWYSPSGKSIILFTGEFFFGLPAYEYIEASNDPGEEGYNFNQQSPEDWLTFKVNQNPVFNAGIAFKKHVSDELMISGGFRTDFTYMDYGKQPDLLKSNEKTNYAFNVYHLNSGVGYKFKRGSITAGMQFSYGQENDQKQIVNLTNPVEFISDEQMPLTGPLYYNVDIRFYDVSIYLGFMFNFMKE
jgi:hypothetical protein